MKILAIETSCDETALALINAEGNPKKDGVNFSVLSNVILSQVKLHAEYGGVYPSLAKREHAKNLIPLLKQVLTESNFLNVRSKSQNAKHDPLLQDTSYKLQALLTRELELLKQFLDFIPTIEKPETRPVRDSEGSSHTSSLRDRQRKSSNGIDAIAVTHGPGLEPALWVGINFAKALSLVWNIPIIPVNHMEGHIFSALLKQYDKLQVTSYKLQDFAFPMLALLISGGHTELVLSEDWLQYKIIGETRDDAIGEAFDKVARMLGLPYPGGPHVSQKADEFEGDKTLSLPRPMIDSDNFDFSFSGIKTAVLYELKKRTKINPADQQGGVNPELVKEFSHEFQEAVTEVVVKKTVDAALQYGAKTIVVGGGVSANKRIREALVAELRIKNQELSIFFPAEELTTDNALMIGVAGYLRHNLQPTTHNQQHIKATGTLRLS